MSLSIFLCLSYMSSIPVRAETIVISDTVPTQVTNWTDELVVPAFNPSLGQLTSITVTLITPINGTVSYENTSDEPVVITSTHAVSVDLEMPDKTMLTTVPSVIRYDTVAPFDGNIDFRGESGNSFSMNTSLTVDKIYSTPAKLALFYGDGLLHFPITATGASSIQGPGNYSAILRAQAAGVFFSIYFNYLPWDIEIEKLTNGRPADDADGRDVPVIAPGAPITWTYLVHNTGGIPFTQDDITVEDSDAHVAPQFVATSDDGDGLLSPGETWLYQAIGVAADLREPTPDLPVVPGCRGVDSDSNLHAYENVATVIANGLQRTDPSHYCNPTSRLFAPGIALEKYINGKAADAPNNPDVPRLFPGERITWTYLITNTGDISFTQAQLALTDSDTSLTINFDPASDDGDSLLAPGESWRYYAVGFARNLLLDTSNITIVDGCDPDSSGILFPTYQNIGTVVVQALTVSDPGHYCNYPPTSIEQGNARSDTEFSVYIPYIDR
ncbi:MAG: choice-of-anchor E domain-containing protein [Caldilineaceae bacterium]